MLEPEAKGRAVWRPGLAIWWELVFGRELRLTLQSTPSREGAVEDNHLVLLSLHVWSPARVSHLPNPPGVRGRGSLRVPPAQVSLPGHRAGGRRVASEAGREGGFGNYGPGAAADIQHCPARVQIVKNLIGKLVGGGWGVGGGG